MFKKLAIALSLALVLVLSIGTAAFAFDFGPDFVIKYDGSIDECGAVVGVAGSVMTEQNVTTFASAGSEINGKFTANVGCDGALTTTLGANNWFGFGPATVENGGIVYTTVFEGEYDDCDELVGGQVVDLSVASTDEGAMWVKTTTDCEESTMDSCYAIVADACKGFEIYSLAANLGSNLVAVSAEGQAGEAAIIGAYSGDNCGDCGTWNFAALCLDAGQPGEFSVTAASTGEAEINGVEICGGYINLNSAYSEADVNIWASAD